MRKFGLQQAKKRDMTIPLLVMLLVVTTFLLVQFVFLLNKAHKHNSDEIELLTLSHNVLHDNNYLIKALKIYVLNLDEKYLIDYINMLNNYDSFYGRLERMKIIGLTESETEKTDQIMEIWDLLEEIESGALLAIENGDHETAVSIIYSDDYVDIDNQLAELIQSLIDEIEIRGRQITASINKQIQIVMNVFSVAFLIIVTTLALSFRNNNRLKDLYKKQKEDIEIASHYKSTFLATMSHEIRTPMNAILGITEIQLRNENIPEETGEAFGKIFESGNLLLHIINDILDLSKIEAGKLELIPVKYDIPSLINDTIQLNRLRYESKPIEFDLELDENTPHDLIGDELRIKQILNNILSNAFKYTDRGKVTMSIYPEYNPENEYNVTMFFRISDTGQGMTKEQVNRLFDEYTRFNPEANRSTIGTGLGMNIARRLVELINGKISVESKLGEGSVFTVSIPQKSVGFSLCGPELAANLMNFKFQSTTLMKRVQIIREYMPYGSVLVVDDVESNLFVAKGMLLPYGLKIDTAESGFETIEKVKNGNVYDIIFMDHMMPKMDGIEAVKILREMGYTNTIVALTANALVGQAGMFLQNGFDGYISKPIDSRELNALLNEFIRDRKRPESS